MYVLNYNLLYTILTTKKINAIYTAARAWHQKHAHAGFTDSYVIIRDGLLRGASITRAVLREFSLQAQFATRVPTTASVLQLFGTTAAETS
jgi:hypothetical protein